jgi:hypothetical protein
MLDGDYDHADALQHLKNADSAEYWRSQAASQ